MSAAVLVLRPEPAAGRTAERIAALGLVPIVYPLFALEPVGWAPPAPRSFDAILLTSANAVGFGGVGLAQYRDRPTYAVGPATALAAVEAGFGDVRRGGGDVAATVPMIVADGYARVLHPCGSVVRPYDPHGLDIQRLVVYRTVATGDSVGLASVLPEGRSAVLVHSPRAGVRLAELVSPADRARLAVAAISLAAANACGQGWRAVAVAALPDEEALLRCLQMLV